MSFTFDTYVGKQVIGKILAAKRFFNLLNDTADIPGGAVSGPVTVQVLKDVTASDIVSGTTVTDGTDNSSVTATVKNKQVTFDILPSNQRAWETQPKQLANMSTKVADGFMRAIETDIIAALVAATPGDINTLTVGQIDFTSDGTEAEAVDNLSQLDKVIATVMGNNGSVTDGMYILMAPTAYGNWMGQYDRIYGASKARGDGLRDHRGVPVFQIGSTSTNWGTASKACMFIGAGDGLLMTAAAPGLHGGSLQAADDGTYKYIWTGPYMYGVLEAELLGEILNPAS